MKKTTPRHRARQSRILLHLGLDAPRRKSRQRELELERKRTAHDYAARTDLIAGLRTAIGQQQDLRKLQSL